TPSRHSSSIEQSHAGRPPHFVRTTSPLRRIASTEHRPATDTRRIVGSAYLPRVRSASNWARSLSVPAARWMYRSLVLVENRAGPLAKLRIRLWEPAPRAGLEPATLRLTAGCSTIELPRIGATRAGAVYQPPLQLRRAAPVIGSGARIL